jgi:hypothetical protein
MSTERDVTELTAKARELADTHEAMSYRYWARSGALGLLH